MDIYEYAKEYDADYYDYVSGYIYKIQEYNHLRRSGLPTPGIAIVDFHGNMIGYARNLHEKSNYILL